MTGMETSIEINRPVASVFRFFLDLERNVLATDPKVRPVIKTTEGPVGPGTTYLIRQPVFGRIREQRTRIVAVDANKRIDMEAQFGWWHRSSAFKSSQPEVARVSPSAARLSQSGRSNWSRHSWTGSASELGSRVTPHKAALEGAPPVR